MFRSAQVRSGELLKRLEEKKEDKWAQIIIFFKTL